MKTAFAQVLLIAVVASAGPAQATPIHNNIGLTQAHQTLDFESVVLGFNEPVNTQFSGAGASFLNAFANADMSVFPNIGGNRVGDFQAGIGGTGLFTIDFANDLQQVAFAIVSAPGTATFQAFLNGGLVETFTGSTSTTDLNNFYGFQGIVLDRLTISVQSFDNVFIMDNLQTIQAVPEPQGGLLVAVALAGLGMAGRRQRQLPGA